MKERLVSLDALRGFLIAAMILVNNPGSWSYVYDPLEHAPWHGYTVTDFIFPGFIFVVGISITLSYSGMLAKGLANSQILKKIAIRSIKLMLLGWWLALWPYFDIENLRMVGVLQRISIVFFIAATLFLFTNWRQQLTIAFGFLLLYFLCMFVLPVPIDAVIAEALVSGKVLYHAGLLDIGPIEKLSDAFIAANYEPGVNLAAYIDRMLVPGRLWQVSWDPEGLLSTLPSVSNALFGILAGRLLLIKDATKLEKVAYVMLYGFSLYLLGCVWSWWMPLNKNLWTSSFSLYTSGLGCMGLGVMMYLADVLGNVKIMEPGVIFGSNAISVFVFSGMFSYFFTQPWFGPKPLKAQWMDFFTNIGIEAHMASLFFAMFYIALMYIPVKVMYDRKIFLRV